MKRAERSSWRMGLQAAAWLLLLAVVSGGAGLWWNQPLLAAGLGVIPARLAGTTLGRVGAWLAGLFIFCCFLSPVLLLSESRTFPQQAEFALAGALVAIVGWASARERRARDQARRAGSIDPLTGVLNRAALLERLEAEANRAERGHLPLTLAWLDCDQFKRMNDQHGHLAGDRFLIEAARTMRKTVRSYDSVARLGGDEFVILYPQLNEKQAEAALGRLQNALRTLAQRHPAQPSWSIGAAVYLSPAPPEEMLDRADRLLLRQKQEQRGSVKIDVISPVKDSPIPSVGGTERASGEVDRSPQGMATDK